MPSMITSVTPADAYGNATGSAVTSFATPAKFDWSKEDISDSQAGRVTSMRMLKMTRGKARVLNVEWAGLSYSAAATLLQAFDHEYVIVAYTDALTGASKTSHMYVGTMRANCYTNTRNGIWESVAFTIIQATPDAP